MYLAPTHLIANPNISPVTDQSENPDPAVRLDPFLHHIPWHEVAAHLARQRNTRRITSVTFPPHNHQPAASTENLINLFRADTPIYRISRQTLQAVTQENQPDQFGLKRLVASIAGHYLEKLARYQEAQWPALSPAQAANLHQALINLGRNPESEAFVTITPELLRSECNGNPKGPMTISAWRQTQTRLWYCQKQEHTHNANQWNPNTGNRIMLPSPLRHGKVLNQVLAWRRQHDYFCNYQVRQALPAADEKAPPPASAYHIAERVVVLRKLDLQPPFGMEFSLECVSKADINPQECGEPLLLECCTYGNYPNNIADPSVKVICNAKAVAAPNREGNAYQIYQYTLPTGWRPVVPQNQPKSAAAAAQALLQWLQEHHQAVSHRPAGS